MNAPAGPPVVQAVITDAHMAAAKAQFATANAETRAAPAGLMAALERITGHDARDLARAVAERFGYRFVETADLLRETPAFDLIPLSKALTRNAALLRAGDGGLTAVFADPFDTGLITWLDAQGGNAALTYALAAPADLKAWLAKLEESARAFEIVAGAPGLSAAVDDEALEVIDFSSISGGDNPVVRIVNSTLYDAMKQGASDIHLEASASGLAIKFRLDGVLIDIAQVPGVEQAERIVSRIKVLSELDIAERRRPQDGSFRVRSGAGATQRAIDIRVSIMPTVHGEDAVLRILDKAHLRTAFKSLTLEGLGFTDESLRSLRKIAGRPHGMVLVTGPTGSGKTTTLYGLLAELDRGRDKLITIEDPVEYQMAGIPQIPVNEKKGLTFAVGLRSILRHDPDVIMVGEIRDAETAVIAVQAALTGHLVLATMHTNSGLDVFGRFEYFGVDSYLLVSALNGVLAQRLVRLNCPHCSKPHQPDDEELELSGLTRVDVAGMQLTKGEGCGDCRGTGYRGRRAIDEFVFINEEVRALVARRAPIDELRAAAQRAGMRSLRESALAMVADGTTTLEEARRVAFQA